MARINSAGNPTFTTIVCGELQGSATALQLPNIPCSMVYIRAVGSNSGNVYIGGAGVTVPDGTTDVTTGIELDAGQCLPFFVNNLNVLYCICDNAGDDLTYIAYR
jgi:hypothetical protein